MSNKNNKPLENEEDQIFEFIDEEGNVEKFEILGYVELENRDFAVLLPVTDKEEELLVHILEVIEELDSEHDTYIGLDDDELIDRVWQKFMEENQEEFNFTD